MEEVLTVIMEAVLLKWGRLIYTLISLTFANFVVANFPHRFQVENIYQCVYGDYCNFHFYFSWLVFFCHQLAICIIDGSILYLAEHIGVKLRFKLLFFAFLSFRKSFCANLSSQVNICAVSVPKPKWDTLPKINLTAKAWKKAVPELQMYRVGFYEKNKLRRKVEARILFHFLNN